MKSLRVLLSGLALVCGPSAIQGQWIATHGPLEGKALSLAIDTTAVGLENLFVGTWQGYVFQSTNSGDSWHEIDGGDWKGYRDTGFTTLNINLLATCQTASSGNFLFAFDARRNLFRSIEGDTNWKPLQIDQTQRGFNTILVKDTIIFGGTDSGVLETESGFRRSWPCALPPYLCLTSRRSSQRTRRWTRASSR